MVTVDDGLIEASASGHIAPAIVFESGLMSYKEEWNKVFPVLSATNMVFAYDRPGVGRSTPTGRPRDGAAIIEDLRQLLQGQHLAPPYVLVGHSAGGLYMQLYARRYPQDVAGLVLVDPTHPTQFEGEGSMRHRSTLSNLVIAAALTATAKAEFEALDETGREVLASPPVPSDLPIAILVAPDQSATAIASFDNAKRRDFAKLYPQAAVFEITGGHDIPQERPQAVIDAVREVLRRAAGRTNVARPAAPS